MAFILASSLALVNGQMNPPYIRIFGSTDGKMEEVGELGYCLNATGDVSSNTVDFDADAQWHTCEESSDDSMVIDIRMDYNRDFMRIEVAYTGDGNRCLAARADTADSALYFPTCANDTLQTFSLVAAPTGNRGSPGGCQVKSDSGLCLAAKGMPREAGSNWARDLYLTDCEEPKDSDDKYLVIEFVREDGVYTCEDLVDGGINKPFVVGVVAFIALFMIVFLLACVSKMRRENTANVAGMEMGGTTTQDDRL